METNIICGSPGCGKTTYLLNVVEKELKTHDPNEIAFVSFTRQGAYEGRDRAIEKFNYTINDFLYFRTLHSIAFKELGMKPAEMISKKHFDILNKTLDMNIKGYYDYNLSENDDIYLFYINLYLNNKKRADQIVNNINTQKLIWVEKNYRELKKYYNVKDFTDLIIEFVRLGKSLPVKIAIIDEAQDLTSLQWEMVRIAFRDCEKMYIAGDDDQAIYEWSGANVEYFINLKGNIKILETSYRLPERILEFSKSISSKIQKRITKDFKPTKEKGQVNIINDINELEINSDESYLFLSRNNFYLNMFKEFLMKKVVVFKYQNKSFIILEHVTAINTYVRMKKNQKFSNQDKLIVKKYLRPHISFDDIKNIKWFDALKIPNEKIMYYRDLLRKKLDITKCNIDVRSIHSVKGMEVDNVILLLNVSKSVFRNIQENPDSEHRVFYVGATRARKRLYVLLPDQKYYYDIM